jgi:hypothetical protein
MKTGYGYTNVDGLVVVQEALSFKKPKTFVYNTKMRHVSDLGHTVLLEIMAFQKNLSFSEARRTLPVLGTVVNFKGQAEIRNVEIGGTVVKEFNIYREKGE